MRNSSRNKAGRNGRGWVWVTRKQGLKMVDNAARYHLKMSGKEFIRRWQAGEYGNPDDPYRPDVKAVATLLGFAGIEFKIVKRG